MRQVSVSRLYLLFVIAAFVGCTSKPPAYTSQPRLSADAFKQAVEILCDPKMEGRDAGTEGIGLARDYLVERFKAMGLEPAFVIDGKPSFIQPFEVRVGRDDAGQEIIATVHNVGAMLPGTGALKDEVVVIGGHYDHVGYGHVGSRDKEQAGTIHPGADDNASGTAGVVMLAEHFSQIPRVDLIPRRTFYFTCFAGEERGLLGSRYMTTNPDQYAFDAQQINGMINMDMIGRLRDDDLYVFGDATGKQWRDWVKDANNDIGLNIKWDVRPPGGSDHSMFIAAGAPAVFFNTWLHDDYHTPGDTPDKVNSEGAVKVLHLAAKVAERAATESERVVFVQPPPREPRPYLGVQLGSGEGGVLLVDVTKDGPMGKAGAQNGDVLLEIGGTAVASPGDVRGFLSHAKAGTDAAFKVRRGEEVLELTVTMGSR